MSKTNHHAPHPEYMLTVALRENLSPHAVAMTAAKCQPHYGKGAASQNAEREVAWFTAFLIGLTGSDEYNRLCDELGV